MITKEQIEHIPIKIGRLTHDLMLEAINKQIKKEGVNERPKNVYMRDDGATITIDFENNKSLSIRFW